MGPSVDAHCHAVVGADPGIVTLRRVIESDLPILFEHQFDPIANEMADFPPRNRDAFLAHWGRLLTDPAVLTRTIVFDGAVAGSVVSFVRDEHRQIGYWIGRAYWGQGIGTRAVRAFLAIERVRPIYAHVAQHNAGSIRVLRKCGFVPHGTARFMELEGSRVDDFVFRLA